MPAEAERVGRIRSLHLPAAIVDRLRREARRCYPAEACGFLLGDREPGAGDPRDGSGSAGNITIAQARRMRPQTNRAARHDRFLIDAADVFAAMVAARAAGEQIVAVYHSHPDGAAEPSATDIDDAWGEWLHVIVPCAPEAAGDPGCWQLRGDACTPVEVVS